MSHESRTTNARLKRALRAHKAILRRQKQARQPVGPVAMADSWDRVLVVILRQAPDHQMRNMALVNEALKACRPVNRAGRELVKRDILARVTVLRQAGIFGYCHRWFLELLIPDPPLVFKPFDPATLPEPNLDFGPDPSTIGQRTFQPRPSHPLPPFPV